MTHLVKVAAGTTATALITAGIVAIGTATAPPAQALVVPVNPVRVQIGGHPANSGFLVFVENNVTLRNDESEGTMAMGGNLRIQQNYNIAGASTVSSTFIDAAAGDTKPTDLFVGGGIQWDDDNGNVFVQQGLTKVADTSTYTAHEKDENGALHNYRLTRKGKPYSSTPLIDGRTKQSPESIAHRPGTDLINVAAAFDVYRILTRQLEACPANVQLVSPDYPFAPLPRPYPSGARGRLTLTPDVTNVLTMTTTELANLSEITYTNQPSASMPLLINVVGDSFTGQMPNHPGVSGNQAPYILWNFPEATSIKVTGGDSQEGTIYAPHATLTWAPTANIEGNVIASNFNHGNPRTRAGAPREIHDFPFAAKLSCAEAPRPPTAKLTLVKKVINDDNGSAVPSDWTLKAVGQTPMRGRAGSRAVRKEQLDPGSYVLLERGPDGYDNLGWECDGGTLAGNVITLADGDDVTCTLTNDDTPGARPPDAHLTLVKRVVNNDGGSAIPADWVLHADGPTPLDGRSGSDAVTSVKVRHGLYSLTESPGPGHYRSRGWVCTGGTMTGRRQVRVEDGDNVVCTVTNDDVAQTGVGPIGPS